MEANTFFLILFVIISLEAWIKIISSFFTGKYYETDKSLSNGQVQITYRFFYGIIFNKRILHNGLDVEYSWINIEKDKLIAFLKNNKMSSALMIFQVLDAFEVYLKDGDSSEFQKMKPKIVEDSFFEELKQMNRTNMNIES